MSRTFTLAVERVADDRRFADRFRRDPHRALRRYRLHHDQVEAIKSGDFVPLARHGLDVQQFQEGKRHGWRPYWRRAVVGVTVLGAAFGLMGAPAASAASPRCDIKLGCIRGLRLATRRATVGRDQIRLGKFLVERVSLRATLIRAGARFNDVRAIGRQEMIRRLGKICGQQCATADGEPLVLAEAP